MVTGEYLVTQADIANDPDYDTRHSIGKRGGYTWAGGWIDPSVPLGGPKEHPTFSVEESNRRFVKTQRDAKQYLVARALELGAQGDKF